MTNVPCLVQILSPSGNVVANAVVDYDTVENTKKMVEPLCQLHGYTYKISVPHSEASLMTWLRKDPVAAIFETCSEKPIWQSN